MKESDTLSSTMNPYVGPRSFTQAEADRFFGREREARELLAIVTTERLTLFYAPSGAGKSSLIHARLIPGLEQKGFEVLPVGRVGGGDDTPFGTNPYSHHVMDSLMQQATDTARFAGLNLDDFLTRFIYVPNDGYVFVPDGDAGTVPAGDDVTESVVVPTVIPRVLIIDQFEDILTSTLVAWQQRGDFFDQLQAAMTTDPYLWVVLTMREDYVAGLDPYAHRTHNGLRVRYSMQRMGTTAALEAIKRPAADIGQRPFAPGVAETLVNNLCQVQQRWPGDGAPGMVVPGEFIEPVQLQVVCYQLWKQLPSRPGTSDTFPDITNADLRVVVGEQGLTNFVTWSLRDYYEQAINEVVDAVKGTENAVSERTLRDWFSYRLITPERTRRPVYQGATIDNVEGIPRLVVQQLEDKHFLIRAEARSGSLWYELVHDRMIDPIRESNTAWHEANLSLVQRRAELWDKAGRRLDELLLQGAELHEGEMWATAHHEVKQVEQDFLKRSRQVYETTRREQQKNWTIRILLVVLLVGCVVVMGLFFWSNQQRKLNEVQTLVLQAQTELTLDPERGLLLAIEAAERMQNPLVETVLRQAIQESHVRLRLKGHADGVSSAAFSSDGRYIATASWDHTARVWDASTGEELAVLRGHDNLVTDTAFAPDGQHIVTASYDGTAIIWDWRTGEQTHMLDGHEGVVFSAAFSADGERVVTSGVDKTARVWDVSSGDMVQILPGHEDAVSRAVFSHDGQRIVTASYDGTARVWDSTSGAELHRLEYQSNDDDKHVVTILALFHLMSTYKRPDQSSSNTAP